MKIVSIELKHEDEWYKHNYYKTFDMSYNNLPDNIDRIDVNKVSLEEFIERYERPYKPCILLNTQNEWLAKEKWTMEVGLFFYLFKIFFFDLAFCL